MSQVAELELETAPAVEPPREREKRKRSRYLGATAAAATLALLAAGCGSASNSAATPHSTLDALGVALHCKKGGAPDSQYVYIQNIKLHTSGDILVTADAPKHRARTTTISDNGVTDSVSPAILNLSTLDDQHVDIPLTGKADPMHIPNYADPALGFSVGVDQPGLWQKLIFTCLNNPQDFQ